MIFLWTKSETQDTQEKKDNVGKVIYKANNEKQEKKNKILTVQCIICAIVLCVVFCLKLLGSNAYVAISENFNSTINNGLNFSDETPILRFVNSAVDDVRIAAENFTNELEGKNVIEETQAQERYQDEQQVDEVLEHNNLSTEVLQDEQQLLLQNVDAIGGFSTQNNEGVYFEVSTLPYELSETLLQPVYGVLTSGFGERENPLTGKEEFHAGIDIAAPQGTAVKASLGGQVVEAGYTNQRGYYVIVHHSQGLQTLYQHLQLGFVHVGQNVQTGQLLGVVGSTGASTGPHLHFELIVNRMCVDSLKQFPLLEQTAQESSDK